MSDTPNGETAKTEALENKPDAPVATPHVEKDNTEEVERLRKQAEQAEMRANQLANQLKAKEEAEAAQKQKELEENNEFKSLYEQERAKREELESERASEEQKREINIASQNLLKEYSDDVKQLADDAGISLQGTSDEEVAAFKSTLDKFQARLGKQSVSPNNPVTPTPSQPEPTGEDLRMIS